MRLLYDKDHVVPYVMHTAFPEQSPSARDHDRAERVTHHKTEPQHGLSERHHGLATRIRLRQRSLSERHLPDDASWGSSLAYGLKQLGHCMR